MSGECKAVWIVFTVIHPTSVAYDILQFIDGSHGIRSSSWIKNLSFDLENDLFFFKFIFASD